MFCVNGVNWSESNDARKRQIRIARFDLLLHSWYTQCNGHGHKIGLDFPSFGVIFQHSLKASIEKKSPFQNDHLILAEGALYTRAA
jgi:hypothetical protein